MPLANWKLEDVAITAVHPSTTPMLQMLQAATPMNVTIELKPPWSHAASAQLPAIIFGKLSECFLQQCSFHGTPGCANIQFHI